MPEHQKVLDKGQRELRNIEPASPPGRGSPLLTDIQADESLEQMTLRQGHQITADIEKLNLNSVRDFDMAQYSADRFLNEADFAAAEQYYRQMLKLQQKSSQKTLSLADTLENLAAVDILLASNRIGTLKKENEKGAVIKFEGHTFFVRKSLSETLFASARDAILTNIQDNVKSSNAPATEGSDSRLNTSRCNEAANYLRKAIEIRRQLNPKDPDLGNAVVLLSAIEEWRGNVDSALSLYEDNLTAHPDQGLNIWVTQTRHNFDFLNVRQAFVDLCIRHNLWSVARTHEQQLLANSDSMAIEDLLTGYSNAKRQADSIRLVETILNHSNRAEALPIGPYLVYVIQYLPAADREALTNRLLRYRLRKYGEGEIVRSRGFVTFKKQRIRENLETFSEPKTKEPDLSIKICRAMEDRGWSEASERFLKASLTEPYSLLDLLSLKLLAEFYGRQKRYSESSATYDRILQLLQVDYPKDDSEFRERIRAFGTTASLIDDSMATASNSCAAIKTKATKLRTEYEQQLQKRQCIKLATQLNYTAAELENKKHYPSAIKLYKDALGILLNKLGPNAPETADQYLRIAEVTAATGQMAQADTLFNRALNVYQTHPNRALHGYGLALEGYAKFLEHNHQEARSKQVYEQARETFKRFDASHKT